MGNRALVVLNYPRLGWRGDGSRLAKKRWMTYFSFYDFRRPKRESRWPGSEDYEVLISRPDWHDGQC